MKTRLSILFLFIFAFELQAQTPPPPAAQPVSISMVASNSIGKTSPYEVYTADATAWQANPTDQFVKLHSYFDEPVNLSGVELKTCNGQPLPAAATLFVNFDEYSDTNTTGLFKFPTPMSVRSVTINFNENKNICIQTATLLDNTMAPLVVTIPQKIGGSATATTTLKPVESYDVMNLFDARFEFGWSSAGKQTGDALTFTFTSPQKIDKIRLWNGYQRSDVHCYSNSRVKAFQATGDNGYNEKVAVADEMGGQVLTLPKPFEGSKLTLTITEAYAGKKYPDLVISEMRFGSAGKWLSLDATPSLEKAAAANQAVFAKSGLGEVLGKSWMGNEYVAKGQTEKEQYWTFRFRSDGSFYAKGSGGTLGGMGGTYDVLGNYEVKESTPTTLKLRVFGFMRKQKYAWGGDCNGCGRDCNKADTESETQKIFQDFIVLSKKDGIIQVDNVGDVKNLNFKTIPLNEQDYGDNNEI